MIGFPTFTVALFVGIIVSLLLADSVSHRKDHVVTWQSAVSWSLFYIVAALCFALYLFLAHGAEPASLFLTGYTLEKVLAFDNLFVFSLIFSYFKIPIKHQRAALYWGIAGALIFRLIFVVVGVGLMHTIGPAVEIVFALLILFSAYAMATTNDDNAIDFDNTWYVKAVRKIHPKAGVFFICICVIEISDILFSFDSVPAIIAVTKDPFLIYSAMIFAVLGLRSLYFVIAALERYFTHMDEAVIVVLLFIAGKLLASALFQVHVDPNISLLIILSLLAAGVLVSVISKK